MVPYLPLTTSLAKLAGIDLTLTQPPVPEGTGSQGEIVGSDRWCSYYPTIASSKTSVGWFDLRQCEDEEGVAEREGKPENFWPGMGRWQLGIKMTDADISFSKMRYWDAPRSAQ
jgi:hypothetical protein